VDSINEAYFRNRFVTARRLHEPAEQAPSTDGALPTARPTPAAGRVDSGNANGPPNVGG
jgi:hypothetical protein